MTGRKIINSTGLGLCLLAMVVVSAISVSAQGRYVNVYNKGVVKGYIDQLERSSNTFRRDFDRFMDRSNLNGTRQEDEYNSVVANYEQSLNQLRRQYNGWNTWWESRQNVQSMLDRAQPVNSMMNSLPFGRNLEVQWRNMRNDINKVADTYDLPGLNGGGWTGGGWDGGGSWGGSTSAPPSWAVGTWMPVNRPGDSFTIEGNGRVMTNYNGQVTYGRFDRGQIYILGYTGTLQRIGNNLRFYNRSLNTTEDFSRNGGGGWNGGNGGGGGGWNGGGGGNDSNGNMSAPPSWAIGTWRSVGRPSSYTLTFESNGRVSTNADGNTGYGRYYRGEVLIHNSVGTISRNGNGLRFFNRSLNTTEDFERSAWNSEIDGGGRAIDNGGNGMPPSWAVGTFRWAERGASITIGNGGSVTLYIANSTVTGSWIDGNQVRFDNGVTATVTRVSNGLRFYNQSSGETSEYRRQ